MKPETRRPSWDEAPVSPSAAGTARNARNEIPSFLNEDSDEDDILGEEDARAETFRPTPIPRPRRRKRGYGGLVAMVLALIVVAGGAYGIWLNQAAFKEMIGIKPNVVVADKPIEQKKPPTQPVVSPVPATPQTATPPASAPAAEDAPKFTQRLTPEGKEVDPGPGSGQPSIGEGTSVVALTTPPSAAAPAQTPAQPAVQPTPGTPPVDTGPPAQTPPDAGTPAPTAPGSAPAAAAPSGQPAGAQPTLAVGQKAIFYEERTNVAEGSAEPGSIVWSVVQESPGGDAPPEPAIRAEASIPGKNVQLRMTIRRNTDQTLPASHIIEMIFLTPQNFDGGGIDNVLRIAMKRSEQEAGSPLIGVPAKIADGFFLVALNDTKADETANLALLRDQDWIDIPVVYKSGRRALLTLEKGIPGERVFDEAMKAWQAKSSG